MNDYVDCSQSNATTTRNYFYDGIGVYLPKERVIPFINWISTNWIDIRLSATPYNGGYILKRDAKLPNPLKDSS